MLDARRALPLLPLVLLLAAPAAAQQGATIVPTTAGQGTLGPSPVVPPPATPAEGTAAPASGGASAAPATASPGNSGAEGAPAGQATQAAPGATPPAATAPTPPPAPAAPGATPAKPPLPPPGAGPDRMNFTFNFPPQQGGGSAAGSAVTLDYKRDDFAVLTGNVHLRYKDIEIQADRAEIDLSTKLVNAQGNVIVDQGPKRITGTTASFDLESRTGKFQVATAYVAPDYYFSGVEIDKTGDNTFTIIDGVFSSCAQKVPDWSFHLRRAEVEIEGYAHIHNATMDVKDVPILYTPWLLWPAKRDRASGFLIPSVHYSATRGGAVNLAYFQTLGDSFDTTFHLEPFFRGTVGFGDEFRYQPTAGTAGDLVYFGVHDPLNANHYRWKVDYNHDTEDLPFGMRGVVHYENFSDLNYFRDFEHDFDRSTLRFFDSRAFIAGSWGPQQFNLLLNDRKTFLNTGTTFVTNVEQRKLPEVSYGVRSTQLWGSPLYFQFQGSGDYLELTRQSLYSGNYGRFDLFPQVTLPIRTIPWLSLSLTGGDRFTWYGARVLTDTATATQSLEKQSLTRNLPLGSAEMVGPSISKIFDFRIGDYVKFRHLIEPRVTYTYQGDFKNSLLIPEFDEVDSQALANSVRVALQNRLLGKEGGEDASARELILFELARNYSFDPNQPLQESGDGKKQDKAGPLEGLLRVALTQKSSLQAQVIYSTLFKHLQSTSFSGSVQFAEGNFVGLTWFVNYLSNIIATTGNQTTVNQVTVSQITGNQIRLNGAWAPFANKLQLQAGLAYDVQNHLLQQQSYAVNYTGQCYGFRFEFQDFKTVTGPTLDNRDFRFSLTLKNVGTLLDLNNRATTVAP
jgi:LPS-assembly protein